MNILKIFKKKKVEPVSGSYVERFTECDKCDRLRECMDASRVIETKHIGDSCNHYIVGMNYCCLKEEEKCIELFGKTICEMTEEEIDKNIKWLSEMHGKGK